MRLVIVFLSFCVAVTSFAASHKPKLILQITIDQMRGDYPLRYQERWCKGGFRRLLNKGTYYANAHFEHADTETPIGHAALFTGTTPSYNGIVAGKWYDKTLGRLIYNCEDDRFHVIGKAPARGKGRAPTRLLSSTIGDELILANNGKSRMFSVSIKDRGAILPGGHAGKAFWYCRASGSFISSTYYYKDYPDWVNNWNAAMKADKYRNIEWSLLHDLSTYIFAGDDDRPFEVDFLGLGTTFPHKIKSDSKTFYASLVATPFGDELTADFAKTLIMAEKLGQGAQPDFLAVSFSATDYIGHFFGASSLEAEDNMLRVDRLLADFFDFIDKQIGLKNVLIVVSADHGMCEAPEKMASMGFDVGRLTAETITEGIIRKELTKKFNVPYDIIRIYEHPYIYLNEGKIAETKYSVAEIETAVAKEIEKIKGIRCAVAASDIRKGTLADTELNRRIVNNYHPMRSGNIHIVADQFWYFYYQMEPTAKIAATHGSPWSYDSYVPIFFMGRGIPHQRISRRVTPYDISVTLAQMLDIKPPSAAIGTPLREVLDQ
jgi:predicted AlkP superfamily pyrophosphatase or phosphodiesterase